MKELSLDRMQLFTGGHHSSQNNNLCHASQMHFTFFNCYMAHYSSGMNFGQFLAFAAGNPITCDACVGQP